MKNSHFETLSKYLYEKRLAKEITQGNLARVLGYASPQFISNWERGLAKPPLSTLKKMIKILDLDVDELLTILMKIEERRIREYIYGEIKISSPKKKKNERQRLGGPHASIRRLV